VVIQATTSDCSLARSETRARRRPPGGVLDEPGHLRARDQLRLGRLHAGGQVGIAAQALGEGADHLDEAPPHRIGGVGGHLSDGAVKGADEPVAVDQTEDVGQPEQEPRIGAHLLAIARQHLVHQLAHRGAEVGPIQRVAEGAGERLDRALVPALALRDLDGPGQKGSQGLAEEESAQPGDDVRGGRGRELIRRPARGPRAARPRDPRASRDRRARARRSAISKRATSRAT
jgi:hypothetical protein